MRVREERVDVARQLAARGERALAVRPGVVAARRDDVELLDREIADVGHPEPARHRIESEAEGIAEAGGEDLAALPDLAEVGIVGRDGAVEVQAQHLPHEDVQVLRVRIRRRAGTALVVAEAGVADADVELPVRSDAEAAAVVVAVVGLRAGDEDGERPRHEGVAGADRDADDLVEPAGRAGAAAGVLGAIEIHEAVGRIARVDRDAEQPHLRSRADGDRRHGRERRAVGELQRARLLGDEHPPVGEERDRDRAAQAATEDGLGEPGDRHPSACGRRRRDGGEQKEGQQARLHALIPTPHSVCLATARS